MFATFLMYLLFIKNKILNIAIIKLVGITVEFSK